MAQAKKSTQEKTTPPAPVMMGQTTTIAPTHEQISRRAYELYLARGGKDGAEQSDWLQAEQDLTRGRN
jgi:hypothetical protein